LTKGIREINLGVFNGKVVKEAAKYWDKEGVLSAQEFYQKRYEISPPKGENYKDVEKRMYSFLKDLEKKVQK